MVNQSKKSKRQIYYSSSILDSVFSRVRYHPILENFPEYQILERDPVPLNMTERFGMAPAMITGRF